MIQYLKNIYHLLTAAIATAYYGNPSKNIKVIGVTGTDGKTTTTSLIYHIITQSGKKASMVSTVFAKVGNEKFDTGVHVSTPHSFTVQKFLKQSVENGDEYFVLETTSHGLAQNRIWGIEFVVGVVTNITHEHLDYHGDYENYLGAKAKLLKSSLKRVINRDDRSYPKLMKIVKKDVYSYGLKQGDFNFDISKKIHRTLPEFNKYNFLAAYTACHVLGFTDEEIFSAMKTFEMPIGRMEVIQEKPFTVVVDYAHTPYATKVALEAMHELYMRDDGRLIHVVGAEGRRDQQKRSMMGKESGKKADFVIITEVDYRDEDPDEIAKEIGKGLQEFEFTEVKPENFGRKRRTYTVINEREKAIDLAISIAQPGDVVICTGKGHEKSLDRGNKEYAWDEQEAVREALKKYKRED